MQIDTIKKKEPYSKEIIDLRLKQDKKTFKLTYLKVIFKDKKNIVFYLSLILTMGLIIFFWSLNFRNSLQDINKSPGKSSINYQEMKSAYDAIKKKMNSSLDSIKKEFQTQKDNKTQNINPEQQSGVLLNSLTDEQKQELINKLPTNTVPQEFSQEELKVRLNLLNKNQ